MPHIVAACQEDSERVRRAFEALLTLGILKEGEGMLLMMAFPNPDNATTRIAAVTNTPPEHLMIWEGLCGTVLSLGAKAHAEGHFHILGREKSSEN